MSRKPAIAASRAAHPTRFAWWAAFLVTLALIAALGWARSAQAQTVPASASAGAAALLEPANEALEAEARDESEAGEELFESEECVNNFSAECEEEGEEEGEAKEGRGGQEGPESCLLSSATAAVSASPAHNRVQLVIHYTTFSPAAIAIDYWLRGARGPLSLSQAQKHFGRTGTYRQTETLAGAQMAKVMAATDFTVQLHAVNAPSYCHHLFDQHLTARHAVPGGLAWSDPRSSLRRANGS